MELTVASDGVHLAAFRPRAPASVANGGSAPGNVDEAGYYQWHGDESSVASRTSGALTGYETLDSPPHYDFYANTEVWGRRRRFRPSLYQLYATPEVETCSLLFFFWWLYYLSSIGPINNLYDHVFFKYVLKAKNIQLHMSNE